MLWVGFNKRNPHSVGAWEWSDDTPVSTTKATINISVLYYPRDFFSDLYIEVTERQPVQAVFLPLA